MTSVVDFKAPVTRHGREARAVRVHSWGSHLLMEGLAEGVEHGRVPRVMAHVVSVERYPREGVDPIRAEPHGGTRHVVTKATSGMRSPASAARSASM
jgi:hypothetical protein